MFALLMIVMNDFCSHRLQARETETGITAALPAGLSVGASPTQHSDASASGSVALQQPQPEGGGARVIKSILKSGCSSALAPAGRRALHSTASASGCAPACAATSEKGVQAGAGAGLEVAAQSLYADAPVGSATSPGAPASVASVSASASASATSEPSSSPLDDLLAHMTACSQQSQQQSSNQCPQFAGGPFAAAQCAQPASARIQAQALLRQSSQPAAFRQRALAAKLSATSEPTSEQHESAHVYINSQELMKQSHSQHPIALQNRDLPPRPTASAFASASSSHRSPAETQQRQSRAEPKQTHLHMPSSSTTEQQNVCDRGAELSASTSQMTCSMTCSTSCTYHTHTCTSFCSECSACSCAESLEQPPPTSLHHSASSHSAAAAAACGEQAFCRRCAHCCQRGHRHLAADAAQLRSTCTNHRASDEVFMPPLSSPPRATQSLTGRTPSSPPGTSLSLSPLGCSGWTNNVSGARCSQLSYAQQSAEAPGERVHSHDGPGAGGGVERDVAGNGHQTNSSPALVDGESQSHALGGGAGAYSSMASSRSHHSHHSQSYSSCTSSNSGQGLAISNASAAATSAPTFTSPASRSPSGHAIGAAAVISPSLQSAFSASRTPAGVLNGCSNTLRSDESTSRASTSRSSPPSPLVEWRRSSASQRAQPMATGLRQ